MYYLSKNTKSLKRTRIVQRFGEASNFSAANSRKQGYSAFRVKIYR